MRFNSGKELKNKEFEKELEKLNNLESKRIVIEINKNSSADDVLETLQRADEVRIRLGEDTVLRVHHNNRYYFNDQMYGFNASSTEEGFTEEKDKRVSNNFTGKQHFKDILEFFLDLD